MLACAELFADLLESKGYRFDVTDKGETAIVSFPSGGKVARCIFSGENGKYLSIYLVYEHIDDDKLADIIFLCNKLNTEYKWFTFYVDNDNDMMVHDDALLSVETAAVETLELLARMFGIVDDIKKEVMKTIWG